MPRVGQWILNVVHLGFQPSEIYALGYYELKEFSENHDIIQKAYKDVVTNPKKQR
jgi:hypothetical protein